MNGDPKFYCNSCAGNRNHVVLAEHKYRATCGEQDVWMDHKYLIVKCAGCDYVSFVNRALFSEDIIQVGTESDGSPIYKRQWEEKIYPSPLYRNKPDWFDDLPDAVIRNIFEELYRSLASESHFLATFGARTVIDRLIVLSVGDHGGFHQGIEALKRAGKISDHEKDVLKPTVDAGHAAAHRGYAASGEELETILDTIEGLVHRLLVLPARAEALGDAVPPRRLGGKPPTKEQKSVPTITARIKAAPTVLRDLCDATKGQLMKLGEDVTLTPQKHYLAFRRKRNFASLQIKVQKRVVVLYLNVDPECIELEEGFTRDVRAIGHYGTGSLEVEIKRASDLDKAKSLIQLSYENS